MKKFKIIIIEDTQSELLALEILLKNNDYLVDGFLNSDGVIENILKNNYDLALVDIILNNDERKGIELAKEIRSLQKIRRINPIGIFIMTISKTSSNPIEAINECQADKFIEKSSVSDQVILSYIKNYFHDKEKEINDDPTIKAFKEWLKTINPNDFTIDFLSDGQIIKYNAEQILEQMILNTEFGSNFKKSINIGSQKILFSSLKNTK